MTRPRLIVLALLLAVAACRDPDRVDARDYQAFWLWAGVSPPPGLSDARTLYLLDGEIRAADPGRYVTLRSAAPRLAKSDVWLVVRTDTLDWSPGAVEAFARRLDRWGDSGTRVVGLQIDFDARTKHLDDYAAFLRCVRRDLPSRYKLSITGLMDWSANGDPAALARLHGVVDEVVIQTYQGRSTIWGYERYFERMRSFPIPFKVGLVEHGRWIEPQRLRAEPNFRGYVVFLLPRSA
ncbi:MAG TPA: DUF3142 domain-containing protein [Sphingomicrobium sp.]